VATISVAIIAKNEEGCIERCLKGAKLFADEIVVVDSIPSYSPLVLKIKDEINITTVSELFDSLTGDIKITDSGEEIKICDDTYVWSRMHKCKRGRSWTKVNYVLRHKYEGDLVRINTLDGLIDVTPNHSLFSRNGRLLDAGNVKIEDKILQGELVNCHNSGKGHSNKIFLGNEELAWCFGFFAAEGSAFSTDGNYKIKFSNKNMDMLVRCKLAIEANMNIKCQKISPVDKEGMMALYCNGLSVYNLFRRSFYNNCGEKKVPIEILNAPLI
jgi:hypothetical protein